MGFSKRLISALAVFVLLAAACSDDGGVDQATVDSVVDDITDDSTDNSDDPPADDPPADDPPADDPPADDPPADDPPADDPPEDPGIEVTSACVFFRHYSNSSFEGFPYHATIIVNTTAAGDSIEATHALSTEAHFTTGADGGGNGFDVNWPIQGPGDVDFPSEILIDGVDVMGTLVSDFFEGQTGFVAAAAEFTDEWIVPDPCGFDIFLPVGNTLG